MATLEEAFGISGCSRDVIEEDVGVNQARRIRRKQLNIHKQQEALRLLDTLASGASSEPNRTAVDRRPIWEIVEEVNAGLPGDTWDDVPTDGSINLDHYLYGAPKQQP